MGASAPPKGTERWSQSPDGDFFDPEGQDCPSTLEDGSQSQSPDGDFFDPEMITDRLLPQGIKSQSPDGDFFDPENGCLVLN